jgi:transcriptional regulator
MTSRFETVPEEDVVRFLAENPLAWIVPTKDPASAVLMPVLLEGSSLGDASLLGHLPRHTPATSALQGDGSATLLFLGPHAYIPPGWISKPGWAPTWNFVSLKATGQIRLDDTLTRPAVSQLVEHMEKYSNSGWTMDQMGPRADLLLNAIVGFRMRIESVTPRFKTGQDESEPSRAEIHSGLDGHPLQAWMQKF